MEIDRKIFGVSVWIKKKYFRHFKYLVAGLSIEDTHKVQQIELKERETMILANSPFER
ncbi:MAG: hypothetical protein LBT96_00735 [Campylobacteraceae bacterium]|nr:hypothetical protein [Campylobacteraceae bacterium]